MARVTKRQHKLIENWTKTNTKMCKGLFNLLNSQPTIIRDKVETTTRKNHKLVIVMSIKAQILSWEFDPGSGRTLAACLIHASRTNGEGACFLKVSGARVSNTWRTYPSVGDNHWKRWLIPHRIADRMINEGKTASAVTEGWLRGALARWWGNGLPWQWCIADLRG